jgi:tetratricopeptide (TPR) repeat protein
MGDVQAFKRHLIGSLDEAENAGDAELMALHWLAVADTLPLSEAEAFELIVSRSYQARARGPVTDWSLAQLLYMEAGDRIQRGQPERALPLVTEAIVLGEEVGSPALAFMYELESVVRTHRGEFELAEARARDAVETHTARVGPHHPEVAAFVARLAGVLSWQGRDADAAKTYSQVIATLEERPDHLSSQLFYAYAERGSALRNTGDLEGALLDYEKAAAIAEGLGEQGASLLPWVKSDRARTYRLMNRPRDALTLIDTVLAAVGSPPADVAVDSVLRAGILADLHRTEEALAQLEQVMPVLDGALGSQGAQRIQAAVEIAEVYIQLGEHDRGQTEIDRFLSLAEDEPMFRSMLERARAQSYADQGRVADARTWAQRALASMRDAEAGQHEIDPIEELIASLEESD